MKEVDNSEIRELMAILEEIEDNDLAVSLLKEFNDRTKELGILILNKDKKLVHDEWEQFCKKAKARVDETISKIHGMR